jgi:hypothetical protein
MPNWLFNMDVIGLVKPTWMLILKPKTGVSLDNLHIGSLFYIHVITTFRSS